jgi:hypothetical protein
MDHGKVKEVLEWMPPTTVSEVQVFLDWLATIEDSF